MRVHCQLSLYLTNNKHSVCARIKFDITKIFVVYLILPVRSQIKLHYKHRALAFNGNARDSYADNVAAELEGIRIR